MIFITDKIYAKVWKVTRPEGKKYFNLQLSTHEKTQEGEFEYSSWFPRVIGHAFNALKDVKDGDKIVIEKAKITNTRYTTESGDKKSAFKFVILDAHIDDGSNNSNTTQSEPEEANTTEEQPEEATTQEADNSTPW